MLCMEKVINIVAGYLVTKNMQNIFGQNVTIGRKIVKMLPLKRYQICPILKKMKKKENEKKLEKIKEKKNMKMKSRRIKKKGRIWKQNY